MIKNKKETILVLIVASVLHLVVDLFSIYTVGYLVKSIEEKLMFIMIYNLLAFSLQLPIGLISDKINKNFKITFIGCLLIFLSYWLKEKTLCIFPVGIGNAMFHIGMGREILIRSENRAEMSGIFVSTGAIGVYLGKQLLNSEEKIGFLFLIIFLLLFFIIKKCTESIENEKELNIRRGAVFCILLFAISIGIRAFVGGLKVENNFENKLFIMTMAIFLGKFLGGILSDKFGMETITVVSLIISAISFLFFKNNYFFILGLFLFNMTMPITLTMISNILNNNKGFAFGITTFMLFIGSSFMYFNNLYMGISVVFLLIIQIILMVCGFYIYKNML